MWEHENQEPTKYTLAIVGATAIFTLSQMEPVATPIYAVVVSLN